MAFHADNTLISNREMLGQLALAPFRAVGRLLTFLAENNSRTQALQAVLALTDEQLRAKGLTRTDAISLTFRHDA